MMLKKTKDSNKSAEHLQMILEEAERVNLILTNDYTSLKAAKEELTRKLSIVTQDVERLYMKVQALSSQLSTATMERGKALGMYDEEKRTRMDLEHVHAELGARAAAYTAEREREIKSLKDQLDQNAAVLSQAKISSESDLKREEELKIVKAELAQSRQRQEEVNTQLDDVKLSLERESSMCKSLEKEVERHVQLRQAEQLETQQLQAQLHELKSILAREEGRRQAVEAELEEERRRARQVRAGKLDEADTQTRAAEVDGTAGEDAAPSDDGADAEAPEEGEVAAAEPSAVASKADNTNAKSNGGKKSKRRGKR